MAFDNGSPIYKIIVLGDSNVGKTCMMNRFCDKMFYDTYQCTIGIDFKQKIVELDGTPVKMQIWDTAGQERFRTLTTAYYRGAMGILLVYDVTNLESFNNLMYWLKNIGEHAPPDVVKVLAGNKCEVTNRSVSSESGQEIADHFDMPFFEVSCKNSINIDEVFLTLARLIRNKTRNNPEFEKFVNDQLSQSSDYKITDGKVYGQSLSNSCFC